MYLQTPVHFQLLLDLVGGRLMIKIVFCSKLVVLHATEEN